MAADSSLPSPAERYFERAEKAYTESRWEDARRDYHLSWSLAADSKSLVRLADVYSQMHKPEKVIETCIGGLHRIATYSYYQRSKKDSARILELAGDAYFELRYYRKAINAYSRSFAEKPDGVLDKSIRDKIVTAKKAEADMEQTPEPLRLPPLVPAILSLPPLPMRPRKDFTKEFQLVACGTDFHETLSNFCRASRVAQCIAMFLVRLVDYVFFFGLGRAYFNRFAIYASDASNAKAWREDQQGEWDRLATGLGLLATMDAAILALSNSTAFSSACWLGGAGMSVCGIFIVQYIPVIAITMSDQEIVDLIDFDRFNPMLPVLAIAVTGPNAIACWSSALFVAGVMNYTYQNTWNRSVELPDLCYQLLTTLPVVAGLFLVFFTLFVGDWVSRHSRPPNARLMRKLEKEQEQQAPALQEKRAKEIEMQLKLAEESPETPRTEVSTSILQPPIETTEAVLAIRAAIALVKIGSTDLLEQRLREPTRSLLERVLAADVLSNIVMETATAMATDQNVKLCFPALRQQAVEVLEKAMSSALATTSPPSAATSLF